MTTEPFDALLLLSFGGPEGPDDVVPFLENVTRGRGIPRERLVEVGAHYAHFGGISPINGQCRALLAALESAFRERAQRAREEGSPAKATLPLYWGNRNWNPLLADTLAQMKADGVRRALVFVTSAFGSYSGCRQYRENLEEAAAALDGAPRLEKLRGYFDHPGFLGAQTERVRDALATLGERASTARLVFTAHSVPLSMLEGSPYLEQLREASSIVARELGFAEHDLVFQSRSGAPGIPWLEPDVGDHVEALAAQGVKTVVLVPIGFVSDHMEVVWDLDHAAKDRADACGVELVRAGTVGTHPRFVDMILELVDERVVAAPRRGLSVASTCGDVCAPNCCPRPRRPDAAGRPRPTP